jgi:hypothetical protein
MLEKMSPFFVVGSHRSGTTMLRLMLNRHSRLDVPFESDFIPLFYHRQGKFGALSRPENVAKMLDEISRNKFVIKGDLIPDKDAVLRQAPGSYPTLVDAIFSAHAASRGKVRWGDKTPGYVEEMEVLWRLFPGCRFIHLVRDGRDVANSLRKLSWGSRNLVKLAEDWRWKVTLGHKMGKMIPGYYLEVRYEDLVRQPDATLNEICDFIGESYEPSMLGFHEDAESEMPETSLRWHRSSVAAPNPEKVQSWRSSMSREDQVIFERVAGDALEMFGYERLSSEPTFRSRLQFYRYSLFGHA